MFPEMHLTINEVEKMAARGKNQIKSCQTLVVEPGGIKKKHQEPREPQIDQHPTVRAHFTAGRRSWPALYSDPMTT